MNSWILWTCPADILYVPGICWLIKEDIDTFTIVSTNMQAFHPDIIALKVLKNDHITKRNQMEDSLVIFRVSSLGYKKNEKLKFSYIPEP